MVGTSTSDWLSDSDASSHIFNDRARFTVLDQVKALQIKIGDHSAVRVEARGDIELLLSVTENPKRCKLRNLLYAPSSCFNLLSVIAMRHGS